MPNLITDEKVRQASLKAAGLNPDEYDLYDDGFAEPRNLTTTSQFNFATPPVETPTPAALKPTSTKGEAFKEGLKSSVAPTIAGTLLTSAGLALIPEPAVSKYAALANLARIGTILGASMYGAQKIDETVQPEKRIRGLNDAEWQKVQERRAELYKENPYSFIGGSAVPSAAFFGVSPTGLSNAAQGFKKTLFHPINSGLKSVEKAAMAEAGLGAGLNIVPEAIRQYREGEFKPGEMAFAGGIGALLNQPTFLGRKLGFKPTNLAEPQANVKTEFPEAPVIRLKENPTQPTATPTQETVVDSGITTTPSVAPNPRPSVLAPEPVVSPVIPTPKITVPLTQVSPEGGLAPKPSAKPEIVPKATLKKERPVQVTEAELPVTQKAAPDLVAQVEKASKEVEVVRKVEQDLDNKRADIIELVRAENPTATPEQIDTAIKEHGVSLVEKQLAPEPVQETPKQIVDDNAYKALRKEIGAGWNSLERHIKNLKTKGLSDAQIEQDSTYIELNKKLNNLDDKLKFYKKPTLAEKPVDSGVKTPEPVAPAKPESSIPIKAIDTVTPDGTTKAPVPISKEPKKYPKLFGEREPEVRWKAPTAEGLLEKGHSAAGEKYYLDNRLLETEAEINWAKRVEEADKSGVDVSKSSLSQDYVSQFTKGTKPILESEVPLSTTDKEQPPASASRPTRTRLPKASLPPKIESTGEINVGAHVNKNTKLKNPEKGVAWENRDLPEDIKVAIEEVADKVSRTEQRKIIELAKQDKTSEQILAEFPKNTKLTINQIRAVRAVEGVGDKAERIARGEAKAPTVEKVTTKGLTDKEQIAKLGEHVRQQIKDGEYVRVSSIINNGKGAIVEKLGEGLQHVTIDENGVIKESAASREAKVEVTQEQKPKSISTSERVVAAKALIKTIVQKYGLKNEKGEPIIGMSEGAGSEKISVEALRSDISTIYHEVSEVMRDYIDKLPDSKFFKTYKQLIDRGRQLAKEGQKSLGDSPEIQAKIDAALAKYDPSLQADEALSFGTGVRAAELEQLRLSKEYGRRISRWFKDVQSEWKAVFGKATLDDINRIMARAMMDGPGFYESVDALAFLKAATGQGRAMYLPVTTPGGKEAEARGVAFERPIDKIKLWRLSDKEANFTKLNYLGLQDMIKNINDTDTMYRAKLGDILTHDKLFEEVPELKKVIVEAKKIDEEGTDGMYDPETNTIEIDLEKAIENHSEDSAIEAVRKTLLHEVQHAVDEHFKYMASTSSDPILMERVAHKMAAEIGGDRYYKAIKDIDAYVSKESLTEQEVYLLQKARAAMYHYVKLAEESKDFKYRVFKEYVNSRTELPAWDTAITSRLSQDQLEQLQPYYAVRNRFNIKEPPREMNEPVMKGGETNAEEMQRRSEEVTTKEETANLPRSAVSEAMPEEELTPSSKYSSLRFWKPEVEKVRSISPELGSAFEKYYQFYRENFGTYVNEPLREVRSLLTLRDAITNDSQSARNVQKYMDDMYESGRSSVTLNEKEQAVADSLKAWIDKVREDWAGRSDKDAPINDPNFFPHLLDPKIADILFSGNRSATRDKYIREFKEYNASLGNDPEKAWNKFSKGYSQRDVHLAEQFHALDKAEGAIKIPPHMRSKKLFEITSRFGERVSRRMAYFDAIEQNRGTLYPLIQEFQNTEPVKHVTEDISGQRDITEAKRDAAAGVIRSTMLQLPTGIVDVVSSPFLSMQHQDIRQVLPATFHAISKLGEHIRNSFKAGVNRYNISSLMDPFGENNPLQFTRRLRDIMNQASLRNLTEKIGRGWTYGIGEWNTIDAFAAAKSGNLSKQQRKFIADFMDTTPEALAQLDTLSEKQVMDASAKFVESVQGSYDYRGLPAITQVGTFSPMLALSRFNVEKLNNFQKHVWEPLKQGNTKPLLMATLGLTLGGNAILKIREELTGKKEKAPTFGEIASMDEPSAKALMYRLFALADASSYTGVFGNMGKMLMAKLHGNTSVGYNNVLWEDIGNTADTIADYVKAVEDGNMVGAADLLDRLVQDNVQNYRLMLRYSNPETQENIAMSNKFRDLRTYRQLSGKDTSSIPTDYNKFENMSLRRFKRTSDLSVASELASEVVDKIISDSTVDGVLSPEELVKQYRKASVMSYNTIPSPRSNRKELQSFMQFIDKTQGEGSGQALFDDWMRQREVNARKKQLLGERLSSRL